MWVCSSFATSSVFVASQTVHLNVLTPVLSSVGWVVTVPSSHVWGAFESTSLHVESVQLCQWFVSSFSHVLPQVWVWEPGVDGSGVLGLVSDWLGVDGVEPLVPLSTQAANPKKSKMVLY